MRTASPKQNKFPRMRIIANHQPVFLCASERKKVEQTGNKFPIYMKILGEKAIGSPQRRSCRPVYAISLGKPHHIQYLINFPNLQQLYNTGDRMLKTTFFHPRKHNSSILDLPNTHYILTTNKNSRRQQTNALTLQRTSLVQQLQQEQDRERKEDLKEELCPSAVSFFDFEDDILEQAGEEIQEGGCEMLRGNSTLPNGGFSSSNQE